MTALPIAGAPRLDAAAYGRLAAGAAALVAEPRLDDRRGRRSRSRPALVASSIALVGFGLDSASRASPRVGHRVALHGRAMFSQAAETRAQKLVAIQFFLLAPYVAFESAAR